MYGDTTVIRRRADELREQGVDIRVMADRLVSGADALDWNGRAADALRMRMRDRAALLRDAATLHENAGESLTKHGKEVAGLKDAVADIERRAGSLVDDARAREAEIATHDDPAGVVRQLSPEDQQLVAFDPPPSGHKDWLTVSLPGL